MYKFFFVKRNYAYLVLTIVMFCAVPVMSYVALINLPVHFVYISTVLGQLIVLFMSYFILKEDINFTKGLGIVLVLSGVALFVSPYFLKDML